MSRSMCGSIRAPAASSCASSGHRRGHGHRARRGGAAPGAGLCARRNRNGSRASCSACPSRWRWRRARWCRSWASAIPSATAGARPGAGLARMAQILVSGRAEHAPRRLTDFFKREARKELLSARAGICGAAGRAARRASRVRDTASRWGSCSQRGSLSFSWRLIFAPEFVRDYVVAHEVAHLKEMNHCAALLGACEKPVARCRPRPQMAARKRPQSAPV